MGSRGWEIERMVVEALPAGEGEGASMPEVAAKLGIAPYTVRYALKKLEKAGEVERVGVFATGVTGRPLHAWRRLG